MYDTDFEGDVIDVDDSGAVPVFSHYHSDHSGPLDHNVNYLSSIETAPLVGGDSENDLSPKLKFVFFFPQSWERFFSTFDDLLLRVAQYPKGKAMKYISLGLTAVVAIEFLMVLPIFLFIVGYDYLAAQFLYLAFVMALLSQIPKRFIWRYRPYMVKRGQKRASPKTSSFPSRAVACAVMYCYMIVDGDLFFSTDTEIQWWGYTILFLIPLLVSFARVNLGVHYPTDAIAGFGLGMLACVGGKGLFFVDDLICHCPSGPTGGICYGERFNVTVITPSNFQVPYITGGVLLAAQLLFLVCCLIRPLKFWVKSGTVFGFLFPPMAFRFMYLCPTSNFAYSLPSPYIHGTYALPHWWAIVYAVVVCAIGLAGSIKLKSRKWWALAIFALYWAFFVGAILPWRLFTLGKEFKF